MKTFTIHEYKRVEDGSIKASFEPNEDSIKVNRGKTFFYVNKFDRSIIYLDDNYEGKVVSVTYEYSCNNNVKVYSVVPNAPALFNKYSDEDSLISNNIYEASLEIDNVEYKSSFLSRIEPLYSSVSVIRSDTGTLLEEYTDFMITNCINRNSLLAYDILKNSVDEDDYTTSSDDEVEITSAAKQFVRYKTDLDLVNAKYLSIVGNLGTNKKKISSLDIETTQDLPELEDMLSYFREKVKEYEDELKLGTSTSIAVTFVKASGSTYPVDSRNSF